MTLADMAIVYSRRPFMLLFLLLSVVASPANSLVRFVGIARRVQCLRPDRHATWLVFCWSSAVGSRLTYSVCEFIGMGMHRLMAGLSSKYTNSTVAELFLRNRYPRFLFFYSRMSQVGGSQI